MDAIRRRAVQMRQLLDDPRPFFVEFAGTPKAGKSTCIDIVSHFFRRTGFHVLAPAEGASKRTPFYLKKDWIAFNTWSACYALQHVLEGAHSGEPYNIVMLDRGLFDALAWFEFLRMTGKLTDEDCRTIHDFLMLEQWRETIGVVFLFYADPETSLERENKHTLIDEYGSAMNPEVLNNLNCAYEHIKCQHAPLFEDVVLIDTSSENHTTAKSTARKVVVDILEGMEEVYGS